MTHTTQNEEYIEVLISVVQQFAYYDESKKRYYHGGLSTLEEVFTLLWENDIIKDMTYVKDSELKKYYEKPTEQ